MSNEIQKWKKEGPGLLSKDDCLRFSCPSAWLSISVSVCLVWRDGCACKCTTEPWGGSTQKDGAPFNNREQMQRVGSGTCRYWNRDSPRPSRVLHTHTNLWYEFGLLGSRFLSSGSVNFIKILLNAMPWHESPLSCLRWKFVRWLASCQKSWPKASEKSIHKYYPVTLVGFNMTLQRK